MSEPRVTGADVVRVVLAFVEKSDQAPPPRSPSSQPPSCEGS